MKAYLLDTNVISEIMTSVPNQRVIDFLAHLKESYLSVITLHELQYGLQLLPEGQRRNSIANKLQNLLTYYNDYIIPVNQAIALQAALLRADAKQEGRIVHLADALIASTARVNNWIVATRNTNDFIDSGVDIINPWIFESL
ncbi:MAG: type II toxin-antitoxin system VapC family toxin [Methylococcales bacterium]|nr:type II toxin-antitoxin system VapC family toxin [Methylococcales bacterium]